MIRDDLSDSDTQEYDSNSSSEDLETPNNGETQKMSEYEKQRMKRMESNRARMEALGLQKMASSLMGSVKKTKKKTEPKGKAKIVEEDEEYKPPEMDEGLSSSSDDEEFVGEGKSRAGSHWGVLDCLGQKHRDLPPMPGPVKAVFGVVVLNGKLLVMGGYSMKDGTGIASGNVCQYDSCLNRWSKLVDMNVASYDFACTEVNGMVYAVGGYGMDGVKKKNLTPKSKVPAQKLMSNSDFVDDDEALMQAIALSLKDSVECSDVGCSGISQSADLHLTDGMINERKGKAQSQEDTRKRKRKKPVTSRVQMTEDELVLHFFQFDESGKGGISLRDLKRVAAAHDFTWKDNEMVDMIYCFDSNGDGKLSLDDFRKIVGQCNMIQVSENSVIGSKAR
ncbi:unnamed protein product [Camellia sinensis]